MTGTNLPDALKLADQLKSRYGNAVPTSQAAAVLRDQADRIAELEAERDELRAAALVLDLRSAAETLADGGFAPCGRALGDCGKALQQCGRDGCGTEVVEALGAAASIPPQHAPIEAVLEGLSSGEPVARYTRLGVEIGAPEVAAAQPAQQQAPRWSDGHGQEDQGTEGRAQREGADGSRPAAEEAAPHLRASVRRRHVRAGGPVHQ